MSKDKKVYSAAFDIVSAVGIIIAGILSVIFVIALKLLFSIRVLMATAAVLSFFYFDEIIAFLREFA